MNALLPQLSHRLSLFSGADWPSVELVLRTWPNRILGSIVPMVAALLALSTPAASQSNDTNSFPLPFTGTYQSLASEARELRSQEENTWVAIPQNVYLSFFIDREIVELQLNIEVLNDKGEVLYPIANRMWLRNVAGGDLEVYKLDSVTNRFEQVGDGSCSTDSCSYQYVAVSRNQANPYRQRYTSTISWDPDDLDNGFSQSGSLAAETTDAANGQASWLVFKTWTNRFRAKPKT